MKKIVFSVLAILSICVSTAQDKSLQQMRNDAGREIKKDPNDTIPKVWKTGGILRFTMTQGAQDNWAAGGVKNSIGMSIYFCGYANYINGIQRWVLTIELV